MCDPRCRRDAVPPPELKTDANSRNEGCFHLWKYISVACAYVGLFLLSRSHSCPRTYLHCPEGPGLMPQPHSTRTSVLSYPLPSHLCTRLAQGRETGSCSPSQLLPDLPRNRVESHPP